MLAYGLLNGVYVVACQLVESARSVLECESAVGIDTQFYLFLCESLAYVTYQVKFAIEFDSTDFQFYAVESCFHFRFQSGKHFVVTAHPYQSVYCYTLLATCKRRVEEYALSAVLQVGHGSLYTKEYGRVGAQHVVIDVARQFYHTAD